MEQKYREEWQSYTIICFTELAASQDCEVGQTMPACNVSYISNIQKKRSFVA